MTVAVLGASGFIGRRLVAALRGRGDDVITLSLRDPAAAARACAAVDTIVNLAGAAVAKRWSEKQKLDIVHSRVDLPHAFIDALASAPTRPGAYVSASAIGYYGTSRTQTFVESSPPGDDFLARTCIAWEREAARAADLGMRVSTVRTGIVLGTGGGALPPLLVPFRLGLGGPVASGEQWMSWIHEDDQVGVYLHAIDGGEGAYDATAPNPVTNRDFTKILASVLRRPAIFPVPALAMQLVFGEGAIIVTEGQRVLPERTTATGYTFRYPVLDGALRSIL